MTETARTTRCQDGVDPAIVAAWAAGDADGADEQADLAAHVARCPVCGALATALGRLDGVGQALRADVRAPVAVTSRALGRIRLEAEARLVFGTFLGGAARLGKALPAYLRGRP